MLGADLDATTYLQAGLVLCAVLYASLSYFPFAFDYCTGLLQVFMHKIQTVGFLPSANFAGNGGASLARILKRAGGCEDSMQFLSDEELEELSSAAEEEEQSKRDLLSPSAGPSIDQTVEASTSAGFLPGLHNSGGNFCFLNSTLQVFRALLWRIIAH